MCGIAGLVGRQEDAWLSRMVDLQTHRGPDDSGEYRDREAGVALGMRRLSIIDVESGRQPMSNEDGSVWIVHNGEIYNAPDLRPGLEAKGHRFRTDHSDTEVLLHLYEEEGEGMLGRLNGMFAFVIYDRARQVLFGARDRMGIKPLYYAKTPGLFAFASELKAILALPCVPREIDPSALYHYMSLLYVPGEDSIVLGVKRLPAGHAFRFEIASGEFEVLKYWDLPLGRNEQASEEEWAERIRVGIREAVKRWSLSDVPIGCSLSGGIDSSAVVGLLAETGHRKIKTYSLGFAGKGEEEWNELPLARRVAERWGTEHHEQVLSPGELLDDLVSMVWHLDEPYGGGLPSWYVFRFMSESVKVGLTGTGGDECFGNYGKFRLLEESRLGGLMRAHPAGFRMLGRGLAWAGRPMARLAEAVPDGWIGPSAKRRLAGVLDFGHGPAGRYYCNPWYYFTDEAKRDAVFQAGLNGTSDTAAMIQALYDRSGAESPRDGIAYVDFKTQLPEEFLFMSDRFSMAHSLEARVPVLDHEFVEMVFGIPASVRTRPADLKYLFKKAVADLLPADVMAAPKRGFVIPITLWLRNELRPLAERLLGPERLAQQGIFRPSFYGRYVLPHIEGRADFTWQVWAALMFQLWHVVFVERAGESAPVYGWRDIAA